MTARPLIKWLAAPALIILVGVAIVLRPDGGSAPAGAQQENAMAVDADPSDPDIDATAVRSVGQQFQVSFNVTNASTPWQGYQVVVDHAGLAFVPTDDVDVDTTLESWHYTNLGNATLQAAVFVPPDHPTWLAGGAARASGPTTATGSAIVATFQCVSSGTTSLHLVTPGEDYVWPTATIDQNGAYIDTALADAVIACGGGDNYKLPVPDFNQRGVDAPWAGDPYDAINSDIAHSGCALSSAADVLAYYGVSTNPRTLNNCLKAQPGGYVNGGVNWVVAATKCAGSGVQLKASSYRDTNTSALRASLDAGHPVILGVQAGGYNPGHWVVAIGPNGSTWWINDPAGPADTLNTYGNTFSRRVVIAPVGGSRAQAVLRAHSPVEFILTDPLGRRLGLDPRTDTFYDEIPDASYGSDGAIVDEETGEPVTLGTKSAWLNSPVDGEYTIQVIGTDSGVYAIEGEVVDQDGGFSHVDGPAGPTSAGQVDEAELHYTSDPSEDNDGVLADIDNCLLVYNPDQLDTDADGVGNACDPDDDNDGLGDVDEVLLGTDPLDPDTDADGCADGEEVAAAAAPKPGATGAYDPLDVYDFYDVPVPASEDPTPNGSKNQAATMSDVLGVLFYVGAFDGDGGVPNPNGVAYDSVKGSCDWSADTVPDEEGLCYDRSPSALPNPPWDAGPPSGAVSMADVLAVLAQVGLSCAGPP